MHIFGKESCLVNMGQKDMLAANKDAIFQNLKLVDLFECHDRMDRAAFFGCLELPI